MPAASTVLMRRIVAPNQQLHQGWSDSVEWMYGQSSNTLGGIIHTYQKYDPVNFPSPTQPPPDLVSPAFEHMLIYGEHAPADR